MLKCFDRKYQINVLNNIWVVSCQIIQDTTQTIFALDPDGWVMVSRDLMASTIFVNNIGSWWMSQGYTKLGWKIQYFWILLYDLCEYYLILKNYSGFRKYRMKNMIFMNTIVKSLWIREKYIYINSNNNLNNFYKHFTLLYFILYKIIRPS